MNKNVIQNAIKKGRKDHERRIVIRFLSFFIMVTTTIQMIHPSLALTKAAAKGFVLFAEEDENAEPEMMIDTAAAEGSEEAAAEETREAADAEETAWETDEASAEETQEITETDEEIYTEEMTEESSSEAIMEKTAEAEEMIDEDIMNETEEEKTSSEMPAETQENEETGTEDETIEEMTEEEKTVLMSETDLYFEETTDDNSEAGRVTVIAEAPAGAFPEGTVMKVKKVSLDKETEQAVEESVRNTISDDMRQAEAVALDISFWHDEKEIEPEKPVTVRIKTEMIRESDGTVVVHVDDENNAEALEQKNVESDEVVFDTDGFSIFVVVTTTIEQVVLAGDGHNYRISVTYGPEAGVPKGARLAVDEILQREEETEEATEYETYLEKTREALGLESSMFAYARIFDIRIVDADGKKVQIKAPVDVKIELADKAGDDTHIVHFADGSETGDVVDGQTSGSEVSFEAEGFSAYAIVEGPQGTPADWHKAESFEELISRGSETGGGLYIGHPNGYYYGNTVVTDKNRTGIAKTKPKQSYPPVESAAKYYFEQEGSDQVYAYCYAADGTTKQYVYNGGNNSLSFTADEAQKTAFTVTMNGGTFTLNNGSWYWNMQGGENGSRFCCYNNAGDVNNSIYFWYCTEVTDEPYDLDGKSYGLMIWTGGPAGKAMMAKQEGTDRLAAKALTVMCTLNNKKRLFAPNESEISMWTFHWAYEDRYYLTTVADGSTKYLSISENGPALVSSPDVSCRIRVIPGTGIHAGQVCLGVGETTLSYSGSVDTGFSVNGSVGNEWLNFVELSELTEEYFRTYSASKVSVSDQGISNGSRVIVYARSWNEEAKRYEYYAIGSDGTLVPVYESGDSVEWVSGQLNKLLWNFVEYHWEGTEDPNFYYELYNQYSEKFIARRSRTGRSCRMTRSAST